MRLASLQPSISITLRELGRLDALCACTKYCVEAVPELAALGLPVLQDSWSFDRTPGAGSDSKKPGELEKLLAARPELVIASVPYRMESLAAILKCGVPVLALTPHSLADIYADVRLIASVIHADPEPVVAKMQAAMDATAARVVHVPEAQRPLVYCEEWGKPLIHSQGWVAELVEAAGGRFAGTPGAHTAANAIAALDPDVLLFAWCGVRDRVPLARVIEQRGWHSLRAVKAGRVHCIPDEFLNTPAPTLMEGLRCIAAAVQPGVHMAHPAMLTLAVTDRER